jgi:hypothetical protein
LQQLDDAAKHVTSESAAAFWDDAGAGGLGDVRSDTVSFEQATELGLLKKKDKPS